jgi:hypothetical protein
MDQPQDVAEELARDSDLRHPEGDIAAVTVNQSWSLTPFGPSMMTPVL